MDLLLIRHAPTSCNLDNVFMGSQDHDVDVSPNMKEIKNLRETLTSMNTIEKYYCSPMRRAIATAKAILPDVSFTIDDRLREKSLGQWEGKNKAALMSEHPSAFNADGRLDLRYEIKGGESYDHFINRIESFLNEVKRDPCGTVLAVTHSGVISSVLNIYDKETVSSHVRNVGNLCLYKIEL